MMSGLSELELLKILLGRLIAKEANLFTVKERPAPIPQFPAVKLVLPNEVELVGKILQGNYSVFVRRCQALLLTHCYLTDLQLRHR